MKAYGFIYVTTNLVNNKRYVGQSKKSVNSTYFGSGKAIKRALRKYGTHNFSRKEIVFAFSKADLDFLEELFIVEFNAVADSSWYNISPAPNVTFGFAGKKHTQEWREARREFSKTRPTTNKMRENMKQIGSLPKTEKQINAARITATKIGKANAGRVQSIEERTMRSRIHSQRSRGVIFTIQTPAGTTTTTHLKNWCADHNIKYTSLHNTLKRKTPTKNGFILLSATKEELHD